MWANDALCCADDARLDAEDGRVGEDLLTVLKSRAAAEEAARSPPEKREMEQIAITVPYGVVPGQQMKATTPDGRAFMITVPSEWSVYIRPPPRFRNDG